MRHLSQYVAQYIALHSKSSHSTHISIKDKETVNIPVWAGVVAVVIGGGLLFFASKKS